MPNLIDMGMFDVTARRTAKREPVGFFRWTMPRLDPAMVFAGWLAAWQHALEGWNVKVSQQILEWQAEARVETRQADLLRLLEKRWKAPVPKEVAEAIQGAQDTEVLLRWFDAAVEAGTFDAFRAAARI
jgi:hypothetical protein